MNKVYCKNCKFLVLKRGYNLCMSLGSACGRKEYNGYKRYLYLKVVEPSKNIKDMVHTRSGLLNSNYDCTVYHRKWYKFWLKN